MQASTEYCRRHRSSEDRNFFILESTAKLLLTKTGRFNWIRKMVVLYSYENVVVVNFFEMRSQSFLSSYYKMFVFCHRTIFRQEIKYAKNFNQNRFRFTGSHYKAANFNIRIGMAAFKTLFSFLSFSVRLQRSFESLDENCHWTPKRCSSKIA